MIGLPQGDPMRKWGITLAAKRRDKIFHLTVTAFAWTMTAVTGATAIYSSNQPFTARVNHRQSQFLGASRTNNPIHAGSTQTAPTVPPRALAKPAASKNASEVGGLTNAFSGIDTSFGRNSQSGFSQSAVHLTIKSAGPSTSESRVRQVENLIRKYDLVHLVTSNVRMGTNQPIVVYLAQNTADYANALSMVGLNRQEAASLSTDTGGFTLGNSIIIALFQNQNNADLANTIAHELTHVLFNDNIGQLPSWINEGLAVSDGMMAQSRVEGWVPYSSYARQMAATVLDATRNHSLVPLAVNEATVLKDNQSYDIELQDWLSVQYLLQRFGYESILAYFDRIKLGETYNQAFSRTFHMTFHQFNATFTKLLTEATLSPDEGVKLTLRALPSVRASVRILQHGRRHWQGFALAGGTTTLTVSPTGIVAGVKVQNSVIDKASVDAQTLYVNIKPATKWFMNGHSVVNGGFAIDYNDGMYEFSNAWMTLASGRTVYTQNPSLFGITLADVEELSSSSDPVIAWLIARSNF